MSATNCWPTDSSWYVLVVVAAWRSVVESSASDVVTESTVSTARHSTMMRVNKLMGPMRTEP